MKWTKEYRCVKCGDVLTYGQVMYSKGCCPFCGHVSTGTICDTVQNSILGPLEETDSPSSANWVAPALLCVGVGLAILGCVQWWRSTSNPAPQQTLLNLDEMARKWNATPTYFLATSNRVTVQDTTSYGVTTLRIDPR